MDIQGYIQSGIIESYVLGLASSEEAAELVKLKADFPEVDQAVSHFSALLEEYAFTNAIVPPADIKAKILAEIKEEKTASLDRLPTNVKGSTDTSGKRFRLIRIAAAASIILLIVSAALNFYLYNRYNQKNNAYIALLAERNTLFANNQVQQTHLREWESLSKMISDPSMTMIKMHGMPGREKNLATIFWNTKNKDVYVMPNLLPHPSDGKQFQLWALVKGRPVDAGVLDLSCAGVCKMKNIPVAEAFAITLEKEGGSPTPTMEEMYVLGKV